MRFTELLEYSRAKTAEMVGDKLLISLLRDNSVLPEVRSAKRFLNYSIKEHIQSNYWGLTKARIPTEIEVILELSPAIKSESYLICLDCRKTLSLSAPLLFKFK